MMERKALVVGGNGFIGSHLVDRLVECGWDVSVFDLRERRYGPMPEQVHFIRADLSHEFLVREALIGVDVVFHLAWTTIHETSNQDPVLDVRTNLISSIQLIEASRQADVGRFVFISSGGTVYGPGQTFPISESHGQDPISSYGITKLAVEKYLHMFHHLHNLDYVILRPSVPYGPRQNPLGKQGVVTVFLHRVGNGLPITIWGDGSTTRDFFYISDLVEAIMAGAEQELHQNRVFNIGGGQEISLMRLLGLVEETVGRKAMVEHRVSRKFDAQRIVLDISLARRNLDWQPKVSLTQGLDRTWSWISSSVK